MPRTPGGAVLTEAHRAVQIRITQGVVREIAALWRPVDVTDIRGTLEPFARAASVSVLSARRQSALAAQRYYSAFREVEGVPGYGFTARLAPDVDPVILRGGLFGAGAQGMIKGRQRGMNVTQAAQNGLVKASGAAVQIAANGGRETLLDAVREDPAAVGYQRVTDGDPCAFCQMIASQGIVGYNEDTAGFASHSHCGCTAEPAFEGSQISTRNAKYREDWQAAVGGKSGAEALSAFRAHLANKTPATG